MTSKEEYDVLRFIEHNQICHISTDVIEGYPLVQWLKFRSCMEKKLFFYWIQSLVKQLSSFYKCRGTSYYQYVNPYSLVVSEDQELYFLDLSTQSNEKQLKKMQRRIVREHFLPPQNQYYQNASEELDIYGLGKTIQYLLSAVELTTDLSRMEEIKFQKLINKCLNRNSKKSFQHISEIQKYIPQCKTEKIKEKPKTRRKYLYLSICICLLFAAGRNSLKEESKEKETKEISTVNEEENIKTSQSQEEKQLYEELGMLYFLEFHDYRRSREYFEKIEEDALAEKMVQLVDILLQENVSESDLRDVLEEIENCMPESEEVYYRLLFQGYTYLTSKGDKENLLRIGTICLETADEEVETEIQTQMALVYEENEQNEEAVQLYAKLLTKETEADIREELYLKITKLLYESEEKEEALQILQDGIREFAESVDLRHFYMQIQCRDTSIDRETLMQMMNEQLKACPKLKQSEEFLKLLKECGMELKGGNVCEKN